MHADACYPHRRGSRSPSEVHEHTEDGPMPGQRRGRWMPPRQRGHQVHEARPRRKPRMPYLEKGLCWIGGDEMVISDLIPKGAQGFTTSC